jgi:hypothetical protein
VGFQSVKAKMTETMLAPKIGYRVADGKRAKVDALFGIRYWHVSTDLTPQPQVGNSFSQSANWVDAVAGGRIQVALSPKAFIAVAGDAGVNQELGESLKSIRRTRRHPLNVFLDFSFA